ncbi:Uncharacterised protein [Corynebacterium renale]|nr:Uncharacterised protein [Corynebacterium renale]
MTADDYVTTTDLARSLDCKPAVVRRWLRDCEPVKVVGHIKYYRRSGIADVLRRCESYRVSRLIMDGAPPEEFRDSWVEYKVVERILGLAPKQIEVLIRRGGPVWRFQRNRHFCWARGLILLTGLSRCVTRCRALSSWSRSRWMILMLVGVGISSVGLG